MKKLVSVILSITMLLCLTPPLRAEDGGCSAKVVTGEVQGNLMEFASPGDADYQISGIDYDGSDVLVTYAAPEDCTLVLTLTDDESGVELLCLKAAVSAGSGQVRVPGIPAELPAYYRVTAQLYNAHGPVSEPYTDYDHTLDYQRFREMTPTDAAFTGKTVLDLGESIDGSSNFVVVREDVRVVSVRSIEETLTDGDATLMSSNVSGYVLPEGGESIRSGDKLLILPEDDLASAVVLTAGSVTDMPALSDADGENMVKVTPDAQKGAGVEEFYDYIRINASFTADTSDLNTASADPDVEFEGTETAVLFGGKSEDFEKSCSFSVSNQFSGISVNDTLTLGVSGKVEAEWWAKVFLKKFEVTTTLSARNDFTVKANAAIHPAPKSIRLGEIPIVGIPGLSINIPIDFVVQASFDASFQYHSWQQASNTIRVGYNRGSFYCTSEATASSGKDLQTQATASLSLGVRAGIGISVIGIIKADVSGEVGLEAVATAQSICYTATYHHTCQACLDVSVYVYARAHASLKFIGTTLAEKTSDGVRYKILGFYLSLKDGKWSTGSGMCPNREYLVTIAVTNAKNGKPVQDVTVNGLGTTDKNGKVSGFKRAGQYYTFQLRCDGYDDTFVGVPVGSAPVTKSVKMYPKLGIDVVVYTMEEWANYSPETRQSVIDEYLASEGIMITLEKPADFKTLAAYVLQKGRTQDIKFRMNLGGDVDTVDLSDFDWVQIGNNNYAFQGEFDGTGLTFEGLTGQYAFFGKLGDGAWVHDLALRDVAIQSSKTVGALAAQANSGAVISDISVSGSVSGSVAGGIVGSAEGAAIRNCYVNRLSVTGSQYAGGLAGTFVSGSGGELANCYAVATVQGPSAGLLCGSADTSAKNGDALYYLYYPADSVTPAFGTQAEGTTTLAFPVTEEQARGIEEQAMISDSPDAYYANVYSLVDALNLWYKDYGTSKSEEGSFDQSIPESDVADKYNHWYNDEPDETGEYSNDGYPVFAAKAPVYPLTVHYLYEDGSEAKPTVTVYYAEGEHYDVDSYRIEGYYTNDLTYEGTMPGYSLDFFVIYYKETDYVCSGKDLQASKPQKAGDIVKIADLADLQGLVAYVSAGGNSTRVRFEQTANISFENAQWSEIGNQTHPFSGVFDGRHYSLTGLTSPLFGYTSNAELDNIALSAQIGASKNVGALVCVAQNTTVDSCEISGSVTSSKAAGGLAAQMKGCNVKCCSVNATVQGAGAGAIAAVSDTSQLINCTSAGTVKTTSGNAGGLLGKSNGDTILNSYSLAAVSGGSYCGGVAGSIGNGTLQNVYFAGTVSASAKTDMIAASFQKTSCKNVFYPSGTSSAVTAAKAYQSADSLNEKLNRWVSEQNSASYYSWDIDLTATAMQDPEVESKLPVLSVPYENWLLDLVVRNGVVSYTFDEEHYGQFTALIALYDSQGRMLSVHTIVSGTDSFAISGSSCASAKAFLLDDNNVPIKSAVNSH